MTFIWEWMLLTNSSDNISQILVSCPTGLFRCLFGHDIDGSVPVEGGLSEPSRVQIVTKDLNLLSKILGQFPQKRLRFILHGDADVACDVGLRFERKDFWRYSGWFHFA